MNISEKNLLPRFFLTIHNAYFQDADFSEFTGIAQIEGELFRISKDQNFVYMPLLTMLMIIETLGSLLTDEKGIKNNIRAFFQFYMPDYYLHLSTFYNLRNTIVHDWDGGRKIDLHTVQPTAEHLITKGDYFVINTTQLYIDVCDGFKKLWRASENNGVLSDEMTERLMKKVINADSKTK